MAREFDDLGFLLPSEFLTDDDLLTDFKTDRFKTARFDDFSYCFGNSLGFNSDLSSPGESFTETESEEDDLVSELTRKLAQSTLRNYTSQGWKLPCSPQSTLCGCKHGPVGSPNSVSGVCSPPEAEDYLRRDLLYAAAEEVARMRMIEETAAFYSSKLFPAQAKSRPFAAPQLGPNPASGFYPSQARPQNHLSYQQLLQAAKQMKQQQQMMKFQSQNGRGNVEDGRGQALSMAAWPGFQQPSSGVRAVHLGQSGPKKERTGTGVFLPQRFGSLPAETRKKSGCPTILLPEKVVQVLNMDVESIDAHLHRSRDYDAAAVAMKHGNNLIMAQQRRNLAPQPAMNQHLRLPHDWTY
ncbi:hypothetical protein C2S51_028009 [Perilla frutescens var. frutescens]|nr:hypothetical protein C2S51_028009 [Perilla frutescens var. frutescens]